VARLNYPAIVTIFDYDDQDPFGAYIAMEYVQGCALDEYVKQRPELHLEDAISAMQQVLGGLAYAHGKDVVHRDVKPSNLLVTRDGLVKITDFGIAKIGGISTQTGLLVGTPQYMAPEQYMGGVVDHRCDIHAAGAVLYELLTGTPAFTGSSSEVMYKVCHEVPKPMSSVDPSIPKVFDAIVAKALEKLPANRYASALDFQQALRASWQVISPKPPSPTLSHSARLLATAIHRQPPAAQRAVASGQPQSKSGDPPLAPKIPSTPLRSEPGSLAAWSREQLAEIERQLLPLVGPMARILVRDAAATTASRQELYQLLARHLQSPEERQQFLLFAELNNPAGSGAPGIGPVRPLTEEGTQRACQLLARYIGPIATILTRKAAKTASDEAQLYALLAEKIAAGPERDRFIREVERRRS
jgi:serine/threonine-protein kinase